MSWWTITPIVVTTAGVMLLPGLLLAVALGFRRLVAVGLAPLFSVAIAGVTAVLASLVGVSWSVLSLLVATAVFSMAGYLVARRSPLRTGAYNSPPKDTVGLLVWAGLGSAVGGVLIAWRTVTLIGNPENIAQRFDNVFHLNAVEWVVSTGDGSSLTLGQMTGNTGAAAVYPAAWHGIAALVVQMTGASVPVAVNALNLVIAAVAWPLSVVLLARVVGGRRRLVVASAGVLSAAFVGFPFLMMVWGPLFPYMLSVALLPAALATVIVATRTARHLELPFVPAVAAVLIAVAGLGLSHLSTVNTLLLLSLPAVGAALLRGSRSSGQAAVSVREVLTKVGAGVLCAGLFIIVWLKLRPAPYDVWGPHQTPAGAVGEALTYSPMGYPLVPVTVSVLAIVGVAYLLVRAESRWFLVGYGLVDYLYVVDAGIERGPLREFMTGIWYADANRLAALLPVFGVVLGALGLNALVAKSIAMARRVPVSWIQRPASVPVVLGERGIAGAVAFAVLIGGLVWLTQMKPLDTYIESGEAYYMRDTPTSVLSSDEYRLLERVPATVPADALIAGNPWNGSTLAFAFTGREVLSHHMFETRAPADIEVAESLDEAPDNEEACDAISESGVSYVLDFGTQYLAENDATGQYAGFDDLATSRAVRLVDEEGAAKLYEVVVCQD